MKVAKCCVSGCDIHIIGSRVNWHTPICVGHLPPPPPLKVIHARLR